MTFSVVDALYFHASKQPTQYLFSGKQMYPDEVFGPDGFMPWIARLTEKRLQRLFDGRKRSGFRFRPDQEALLGEVLEVDPEAGDVHPDSIRLSTLALVASEFLGMGKPGWVDITPVYETIRQMVIDDNLEDFSPWPPFRVLQVQ